MSKDNSKGNPARETRSEAEPGKPEPPHLPREKETLSETGKEESSASQAATEKGDPAAQTAKRWTQAKAQAADVKKRSAKEKQPPEPPEPSPLQPLLERFVKVLSEKVGAEAVEEAYIHRPGGDRPTLVISSERWLEVARLLLEEETLAFDYLENLSGVDEEEHMEILNSFNIPNSGSRYLCQSEDRSGGGTSAIGDGSVAGC